MNKYNQELSQYFRVDETSPSGLVKIVNNAGKPIKGFNIGSKRLQTNGQPRGWDLHFFRGCWRKVLIILNVMVYKFIAILLLVFLVMFSPTQKAHQETIVLTKQEQQRIVQEYHCNKEVLWFESRSEGLHGLKAVMSVVYHRTKHKNYPSTYCGVIQQKFQFSYRNHLRKGQMMPVKRTYNAKEQQIVLQVQDIAFKAATDRFDSILEDGVTMYHAVYMKNKPKWAVKSKFYATIKNHHFYKG